MKNRYSTIRTKAGEARTVSNVERNPKRLKSVSKQLPKEANCSQAFSDTNSREVDEESQDDDDEGDEEDDEDEEEEDDDNEYQESNDNESLKMNWQNEFPDSRIAAQDQRPSASAANQSPSLYLPGQIETQMHFNASPVDIENWKDRISHEPTAYPGAFPINIAQNSYSNSNSYMPDLSSIRTGLVTSPASLHQYHYPEKINVSQATIPENPTGNVLLDIPSSNNGYTTLKEPTIPIDDWREPLSAPGFTSLQDQAAQQRQSSIQSQSLGDQRTGHEGIPPVRFGFSELTPSSLQTVFPAEAPGVGETLKRVSIDALCTPDQISNIMGNIISCAKSVTVKVGH